MTTGKRALLSMFIGVIAGVFCHDVLDATASKGDFFLSLQLVRDVKDGVELYSRASGPDTVPYPLTAAIVAFPLAFLPDPWSSGVFMAISSGLLSWLILASKKPWRMLIFLSWPFVYSLFFAQWTPLLLCLWFSPLLLPLILVKPQIALPIVLVTKPDWRGVVLSILVVAVSLLVSPRWPWVWLEHISGYKGMLPPLFALPLGPILLLALLRWRRREAWLLLLMALMPQRVVYDQLALLLVTSNWREILFLVSVSWLTLPALLHFGGWTSLPGGWQLWIIATLYLPALFVVMRSRKSDEPS